MQKNGLVLGVLPTLSERSRQLRLRLHTLRDPNVLQRVWRALAPHRIKVNPGMILDPHHLGAKQRCLTCGCPLGR